MQGKHAVSIVGRKCSPRGCGGGFFRGIIAPAFEEHNDQTAGDRQQIEKDQHEQSRSERKEQETGRRKNQWHQQVGGHPALGQKKERFPTVFRHGPRLEEGILHGAVVHKDKLQEEIGHCSAQEAQGENRGGQRAEFIPDQRIANDFHHPEVGYDENESQKFALVPVAEELTELEPGKRLQ